jgi:delta 1-pyrroline-5-carboxylate dehydrogenase
MTATVQDNKLGASLRGQHARQLAFPRLPMIGGLWQSLEKTRRFEVRDPSTGDVLGTLPECGEADAYAAVEAASGAFTSWRRRPPSERADILLRLERLLADNREALAELTTLEQGMPLPASRSGVDYACSFFRWFAEEGRRAYGRTIASVDIRRKLIVEQSPRGVVGVITPWNAPLSSQRRVRQRAGHWKSLRHSPRRARHQLYGFAAHRPKALRCCRSSNQARCPGTRRQRSLHHLRRR